MPRAHKPGERIRLGLQGILGLILILQAPLLRSEEATSPQLRGQDITVVQGRTERSTNFARTAS